MTKPAWWRTDTYDQAEPLAPAFTELAGPEGVALVKVWSDGRTDKGWGLLPPKDSTEGFAIRYARGEFNARRVLYGFKNGRWAFAVVMRSVRLVAIDIDGKNGGFDHAKKLGRLPPTLAETSKSGDGYHLLYTYEEDWSTSKGYGELADRIGLEQGVDVRATGCLYHYEQQRWNSRTPAPLPEHLKEMLLHREQKLAANHERITTVLNTADDLEVLMMQDELLDELKKPIPAGRRNNTLFAIGNQMKMAQVPNWDHHLLTRADEVGLDQDEAAKLVANVERYAGAQP